jgi:hypothetical protein
VFIGAGDGEYRLANLDLAADFYAVDVGHGVFVFVSGSSLRCIQYRRFFSKNQSLFSKIARFQKGAEGAGVEPAINASLAN